MQVSQLIAEVRKGNYAAISHRTTDELVRALDYLEERNTLTELAVRRGKHAMNAMDKAAIKLKHVINSCLADRGVYA